MTPSVVLAAALSVVCVGQPPARHFRPGVYEIYPGVKYDNSGDPFVVQLPDRYVMVRCRNSDNHDRVWMSESRDGIRGWGNDRVILEGGYHAQDDLSCSPGVVIDPRDGLWHVYYITSSRDTFCLTEMWHATSADAGRTWAKLGKVPAVKTSDCSLLQPSPVIENGKIAVYFVVNWYGPTRLWRMESDDGHQFTSPSPAGDIPETRNARVTPGHVVYANVADGRDTQNTQLYLDGQPILLPAPRTFYATYVNAGNYLPGPPARVYFVGGVTPSGVPEFSMDYVSSIGVLVLGLDDR